MTTSADADARPNPRPRPRPRRLAGAASLALTATLALGLTACSGAGSGASGDSGGSATSDSVAGTRDGTDATARGAVGTVATAGKPGTAGSGTSTTTGTRALIRTGAVELSSKDVEGAREEVVRIADRYAGQLDDERSSADERGELSYTRLVLRIPSRDYDAALQAVKRVAHLDHATSRTEDVTSELIDTGARLRAQRRSIARIEVLYARADSIRTVIEIERELAVRQADLESLERRVAYLRGQTALSTLTVTIDRTPAAAVRAEDDDGFLAGLAAGWHSLTATATAAATATGALLPWAIVLTILAVPGVPLLRLVRRRLGRQGRLGRPGRLGPAPAQRG